MEVPQTPAYIPSPQRRWLSVDHAGDTTVRIAVVGGLAAERAEELWSTVEYALEIADGRAVTVDLTAATGFDLDTMDALFIVTRTAVRRHDNMHIVVLAGSPLSEYAQVYGLPEPVIRAVPSPAWRATAASRPRPLVDARIATYETGADAMSA